MFPPIDHPIFWLNKKRTQLNGITTSIGESRFTLVQTSSVTLELRSQIKNIMVKIRIAESGLQYIIIAPKEICNASIALGGSCDSIPRNDRNDSSSPQFEKLFRVLPDQSLFSAAIGFKNFLTIVTGSEFALQFDGVGITTNLIGDLFTRNYVTIQMLYFSFHDNGTLFTYSEGAIFSISLINGEFCLITNDVIDCTGLFPYFCNYCNLYFMQSFRKHFLRFFLFRNKDIFERLESNIASISSHNWAYLLLSYKQPRTSDSKSWIFSQIYV